MLHDLITWWFAHVEAWGYLGIFLLMAMESTIVPLPSEVIIPPAAYFISKGELSFGGIVLAGTGGSILGAMIMYAASRWLGRPLFVRFGRYVLITPEKLEKAERYLARYETGGVFFARLLPVIRHLIGIPAGLVRMAVLPYATMTVLGSAAWCAVLTWFGQEVLGANPNLMQDPDGLMVVLKAKSHVIAAAVLVLGVAYVAVVRMTRKQGAE